MKKIFLSIIFLILLTACVRGQVINDPTTYDSVTVLYGDDYFGIDRNLSESRTVSWGRMVTQMQIELALDLLTSDNLWSGANSFTNSITLPGSLSPSLTNGIGFQDGDFAWSDGNGDGLFYGASKAWVLSVIPDSIDISGGDLSGYKTLAGNETVSGINTYTNVNDFRTGTVYMPYKTSYTALIGNQGLSVRSTDGKVIAQTKDASNNKYDLTLASESWVTANVSVTGLKSTGTQTGITSTLTWSSGTLTPYILDPITLKIKDGTPTVTDELAYDGTTNGETGLYVKLSSGTLYVPDEDVVQNMIDANYSYNAPTASSAAIDTLNFSVDRNFIDKIYTIPSGGITLRFNSDYGSVKVIMKGTQEDVTFDAGTSTIKWVGGEAPSIAYASTTNKYWALVFERISSTEIIGSWIWAQ